MNMDFVIDIKVPKNRPEHLSQPLEPIGNDEDENEEESNDEKSKNLAELPQVAAE